MKFIQGHNRTQINLFPVSLNQSIDPDNEVRMIDLFVDSLSIRDYGFRTDFTENGRPAYHPSDLLKLFIYGYMNKVRYSRDLEKECSTKLRAQNSKKNNYNQAKINRHIAYIDNKLEEYTRALAENDGDNRQQIEDEIGKQQKRKDNYRSLEQQLKESGEPQISVSDPESRQIMVRNNITEVAYNVQSTVDSKNCIPIDYKVTNQNDSKAMGNMVQRAKSILRTNNFTVLYDKGFHTGSEPKTAQEMGIETIVAIPGVPSTSQAPDPLFNYEFFRYNREEDTYTCPGGQILRTNGSWYKERTSAGNIIWFKQYKTRSCRNCPVRSQCTRSKKERLIQRSEFAEYYEANRRNYEDKERLYKRLQAIVEHPYGTIKRQWEFSYILTKKGIAGRAAM